MSLNLDNSSWKRVSFGDVIESVTDRVDDPSEADVDRYVGLEHLDPAVMTVQRWDTPDKVEAQKLRFHLGDVIFGRRRAYQKKVALAEFEGICSAHALVLRARPGYIHQDFLPVFLSSDYFLDRAIAISVGSLSPTVNWRDLKVQEFDLPPLDEQQRIADLIWAVERHRLSTAALAAGNWAVLYSALPTLLFGEATGEPRQVGDLATIKHGFAFSSEGFAEDQEFPTVVTPGNFAIGGGFQGAAPKTFTGRYADDWVLQPGDVIVTMTDLSKAGDTLGYSAIVPNDRVYLHNQRIGKVVLETQDEVLLGFLSWVLRTEDYRQYILRTAAGSTVRHTSPTRIEQYELRIPDRAAQRHALAKIDLIEASAKALERELDAIITLRSALLAEIFGGGS